MTYLNSWFIIIHEWILQWKNKVLTFWFSRISYNDKIIFISTGKPVSDVSNIFLGVTDIEGIVFSTTVFAYPKPQYALLYENGTKNRDILDSIEVNAINNFTFHFNKTINEQGDFGFYRLFINNTFGEKVIHVAVIPQRT